MARFLLVLGLAVAAFDARAQADSILGSWSFLWEGARGDYTGTLEVTRRTGDKVYSAKLTVIRADGFTVKQDATVTLEANDVRIECSNPSVPNWNPDRFYVTRSGDAMEGYSLDSAGQRGRKIVFKRM
jgi:hypothetical protein